MLHRYAVFSLLLGLLATAPGCDAPEPEPPDGSLFGHLSRDDAFEQLTEALLLTPELVAQLRGSGAFTLFAPTDDAFYYMGAQSRTVLQAPGNRPALERILRYHIVPQRLGIDDLVEGATFTSLDGTVLTVQREGEHILIEDARLAIDDVIEADNGLIVPLSEVLRTNLDLSARLLLLPLLDQFRQYGTRTGTLAAIDPAQYFTVLAPVDDAFTVLGDGTLNLLLHSVANADVLQRVMDFTVLPGRHDLLTLESGTELTTLDGVTVTFTRENGVLAIDGNTVIAQPAHGSNGTIYLLRTLNLNALRLDQRVRIDPLLSRFEAHLQRDPALANRLRGPDAYTVLGYENGGYLGMDGQLRLALEAPINAGRFRRMVAYHIVPGRYDSASLVEGDTLTSVEGLPLPVRRLGPDWLIGDRVLRVADIATANGVIHHLASPAFPPSDLVGTALFGGFTQHVRAIQHAGLEAFISQAESLSLIAFPNEAYLDSGLFERPDLDRILQYHLTPSPLFPYTDGQTFTPIYGPARTVTQSDDGNEFLLDGAVSLHYLRRATNGQLLFVQGVTYPDRPN